MKDSTAANLPRVPLSDVATVVNGGTPKSKVADYWGGDVQWLTPKDMGQMDGREISETPRTITQAGLKGSSARLVPAGSVILSTRAPIGHLAINTVPMAFNQGCRGIFPGEMLDPVYLYHFLDMSRDLLNELGSGTTFKELSATNLKSVKIPLPPLEEQQRIVAVLDEAFEGLARARAHAEANLQNARELFECELKAAFESLSGQHGVKALGGMTDFRNGFAFKSARFKPSGKPVVRISNIQNGEIDEAKMVFTDPADYSEDLTRYEVQPDDLLIAMSGATTGKVGFNTTGNVLLQNQRVGRFRPTEKLDLRFLYYFLSTKAAEHLSISAGAAQPNLSTKQINEIEIPAPPLDVQIDFLRKIELLKGSVGTLSNNYDDSLKDLDDLRQSLLQKAFAGELT